MATFLSDKEKNKTLTNHLLSMHRPFCALNEMDSCKAYRKGEQLFNETATYCVH